jgi:(2Fe-2S) ferredoxin
MRGDRARARCAGQPATIVSHPPPQTLPEMWPPETMTTTPPDFPPDPKLFYRTHIFCCTNTRPPGHPRGCCSEKGSEKLRNYMKVRAKELGIADTRVNAAGCLDRCELGPTMVIYPEGIWYSYRDTADIDEILTTHVVGGGRVTRLMLQPEQRPPGK